MYKTALRFLFTALLVMVCRAQQTPTPTQPASEIPQSPDEFSQLETKAQAGDSTAQVSLGKAYDDGSGVPQSDQLAVKWYRAAAEHGNAEAQNRLGLMFRFGRGVPEDKSEAVIWYKKAARQKDAAAMFNLGTAYYNGDGVGIDDVVANAWFLLADSFGSSPAAQAVKRMRTEIGTEQGTVLEKVGDMYEKGDDLPQNSAEAIAWYRRASEKGAAPEELVKLASLLMQAQSEPPHYTEVHRLCEKAAKLGYAQGSYCVGVLYHQGLGVERNSSEAAKWFLESATGACAIATLRLGEMYWKGDGVKQDAVSAYEFISLAATSDLPNAKQEKELLEKEMTPKQLEAGKKKAIQWALAHQSNALQLRPRSAN